MNTINLNNDAKKTKHKKNKTQYLNLKTNGNIEVINTTRQTS